jgi:predicted O-methyltransferase YrrM
MTYPAIMTDAEQKALGRWVRELPVDLHGLPLVEIGTGVGGSARIIAEALTGSGNPALLYTIDDLSMDRGRVAKMTGGRTQADVLSQLMDDYPNVHCMRPDEVLLIDGNPALLLIDGDHREEAVRADLRLAASLHSPGGLLILHDYGSDVHDYGPTRAFDRWRAEQAEAGIEWVAGSPVDSLIVAVRI